MIKYISPIESDAYKALISICKKQNIKTERVNELLWSINAEPNLTSLIRILQNLKDIIKLVKNLKIAPVTSINKITPWSQELEQLLANSVLLVEECGDPLVAGPKGEDNNLHPLHNICLSRNPLYSLLWNRADVRELEKKLSSQEVTHEEINNVTNNFTDDFRVLQWHLFFIHHWLIENKITITEYLESNESLALLGPNTSTINMSCQTARGYSRAENWEMLKRLNLRVASNTFFEKHHEALSEQLDPLARPFKTLGNKWVKSKDILRVDTHRRRHSSRRKRSTSYYVEYGENTLLTHKIPEENLGNKGNLNSRVLKEWSPIEGWEESDLPKDEQGDESEEQILVDTPCKRRPSERDQIMAAIGLAHKRAVLNQHLPIHYNLMTIDEIASTMRILGDAIRNNKISPIYKKSAILGISMYWTGSDVERMRKLIIVTDDTYIADDVMLAYFLKEKHWRIRIPVYKTRIEISPEQKEICRPSGEHLYLPDIWNFHSLLPFIIKPEQTYKNSEIIKPFDSHRSITYKKALDNIFKPLIKSGLRVNHQRLSKDILLRLLSITDPVIATSITGQPHPSANTARHYATPRVKHLENVYFNFSDELVKKIREERYLDRPDMPKLPELIETDSNITVGATHCPTVKEARELLERVRYRIKRSITPQEYHMYYTIYVALVISYCTGYRAVRDIRLGLEQRDPVTQTGVIADKTRKDGYHTRRIWISPLLEEQLITYERHLKILFSTWEIQFPNTSRPNETEIPYLFFIVEKKEGVIPVSSRSMNQPLEDLGYPLPLNSNRRFLRTELSERGCPKDVLHSFMGHWATGEEPHNPYSCLSPRHVRKQLQKYLIPLQEEIGLSVITSRWYKE